MPKSKLSWAGLPAFGDCRQRAPGPKGSRPPPRAPPQPGRVSRAMLFSVRARPRWSKGKAGSFSAVSPQRCKAEPCHPPSETAEFGYYLQAETLSYKQDAFWFCGTAFSFEARFSEGLQNGTGPLGSRVPSGNKREGVACAWGPAALSTVETSGKEHVRVPAPDELSHNPASLPGQCPGWSEGRSGKRVCFFFIFHNLKKTSNGQVAGELSELSRKPGLGQLERARLPVKDTSVSPAAATHRMEQMAVQAESSQHVCIQQVFFASGLSFLEIDIYKKHLPCGKTNTRKKIRWLRSESQRAV